MGIRVRSSFCTVYGDVVCVGAFYASKETKLNHTAGEFLDAFLVLSLALVVSFYLHEPVEITYRYFTLVTFAVDVFFFCFMYLLYSSMGKHPLGIRALRANLSRAWIVDKLKSTQGWTTIISLAFLYAISRCQHGIQPHLGLSWSISSLFILIFLTKWLTNQLFNSTHDVWRKANLLQGYFNRNA